MGHTGKLSPVHLVTLQDQARSKANIPQEAIAYAFCYPICTSHTVQDAQVSSLLNGGGFFYFKNALQRSNEVKRDHLDAPLTKPGHRDATLTELDHLDAPLTNIPEVASAELAAQP